MNVYALLFPFPLQGSFDEATPFLQDSKWREPFLDIVQDQKLFELFELEVYKQRRFQGVKGEDPPDWGR